MQLLVNTGQVSSSDALDAHIRTKLTRALGHLGERLTRVEVHLRDENQLHRHSSDDKRVTIEARPRGMRPITVEAIGGDFFQVAGVASGKLGRALERRFGRRA
ncbi:MAG: HPF/RaiA family ribosome-associated protein [Planctomycetota bacterium]